MIVRKTRKTNDVVIPFEMFHAFGKSEIIPALRIVETVDAIII